MTALMRDEKGRFISPKAASLIEKARQLEAVADELVAAENDPPIWLKDVAALFAAAVGVTSEEFQERVNIVHPTQVDPQLTIDEKVFISWV